MSQRFWSFVEKGTTEACWNWLGAKSGGRDAKSYGVFARSRKEGGRRMVYAHRMAYCLSNGIDILSLPSSVVVRHRCDNGHCCNPSHLVPGTQGQNVLDMVERGRSRRGKAATGAVLNEEQVVRIKERLLAGEQHQSIANTYGVHRATISQIARGKNWSWVKIPSDLNHESSQFRLSSPVSATDTIA